MHIEKTENCGRLLKKSTLFYCAHAEKSRKIRNFTNIERGIIKDIKMITNVGKIMKLKLVSKQTSTGVY